MPIQQLSKQPTGAIGMNKHKTIAVAVNEAGGEVKRKEVNVNFDFIDLGYEFNDFVATCDERVKHICVVRYHQKLKRDVIIDCRYNHKFKSIFTISDNL